MNEFTRKVIRVVDQLQVGATKSYEEVSLEAGSTSAAAQSVGAAMESAVNEGWHGPWWRVTGKGGEIKTPREWHQREILDAEALAVSNAGAQLGARRYRFKFADGHEGPREIRADRVETDSEGRPQSFWLGDEMVGQVDYFAVNSWWVEGLAIGSHENNPVS